MAFTSHIVFTGICLFVRPEAGKPPEAAVFMDGRAEMAEMVMDAPHNVYLVMEDTKYLINQTPPGTLKVHRIPGSGGKYYKVVNLDAKLITVRSPITDPGLILDPSFETVPRLGRVWPRMIGGPHKEIPDLHQPKLTEALCSRVNSRFVLPHGTLSVRNRTDDEWLFAPRVLAYKQLQERLPQEVSLDFKQTAQVLQLEIRDIVTNASQVVLSIEAVATDNVTVLLANTPAADLFPADICATEVDCQSDPENICCADRHFALYYKAFNDPPNTARIPHKQRRTARLPGVKAVELFRVGGADCGPADIP